MPNRANSYAAQPSITLGPLPCPRMARAHSLIVLPSGQRSACVVISLMSGSSSVPRYDVTASDLGEALRKTHARIG